MEGYTKMERKLIEHGEEAYCIIHDERIPRMVSPFTKLNYFIDPNFVQLCSVLHAVEF